MAPVQAEIRLESLPGVGPALAQRIRAAYGTDAAFWNACNHLDLDALLRVPGITERRAFELASAARGGSDLVLTDRARDVRRDVEDLLASHAQTSYGKRALRLLPTLRDASAIEASQTRVAATRAWAEGVDRDAVRNALANLSPLKSASRISVGRTVVVDTSEQEEQLRSLGVDRYVRIQSGAHALHENRKESLVVYAGERAGPAADAENVVHVPPESPLWRFVPESELQWVSANRSTLRGLAELSRLRGTPSAAPEILAASETAPAAGPVDVGAAARAALDVATATLADRMRAVSLQGDQILQMLSAGVPKAVQEARRAAVDAGLVVFRERTGTKGDPFAEGLPLKIDEDEVRRLGDDAEARGAVDEFERGQKAAKVIAVAREKVPKELKEAVEFDVSFALGCWALEAEAEPARTSVHLRFEAARNLRLARKGHAEPISYTLGGDAPVAVLTGANSGGKSSLLELLAQLVLLHHWGLPVPARRAEIPILDEVLLFAGLRGADAGALETFLRELFPPLVRPGRKLVLLDEVESMTELEAAGRILGVFLDEVARTESLCVLVTHLPNEVLAHATRRVRVDGIDAVGLDEKFNLLIDRQPKLNHRARSTPELILQRVHARSQGAVKAVYGKILSRWNDART